MANTLYAPVIIPTISDRPTVRGVSSTSNKQNIANNVAIKSHTKFALNAIDIVSPPTIEINELIVNKN